jgi:hypothetical protein
MQPFTTMKSVHYGKPIESTEHRTEGGLSQIRSSKRVQLQPTKHFAAAQTQGVDLWGEEMYHEMME